MDIMLDKAGDLYISSEGDIVLGNSVAQKIQVRLKWFEGEWRWNRSEGLPYRDTLLMKNPDMDYFEAAAREKIFEVEEVTEVREVSASFDRRTRQAVMRFVAVTDMETIRREMRLDV